MNTAVAVTGASAFTPFGVGVECLELALAAGRVGVTESLAFPDVGCALLENFDAQRYVKVPGMRVYARATQLEICATVLALLDAELAPETAQAVQPGAAAPVAGKGVAHHSVDPLELGIVTASTFSHMETLIEYDRGLSTVGLKRTNPTWMPLALPSAPGAVTALAVGARALAITVNDGGASGLSALALGASMLAQGRARVCVVAGAFTLFPELVRSASRAGLLSNAEHFRVLDQASSGLALGEAAAAVVLEPVERARTRGRAPLGYIGAGASRFAANESDAATALRGACSAALQLSDVHPDRIALACVGANGRPQLDEAHALALQGVLPGTGAGRVVIAPKANLGESFDPSGLLQAIIALATLRTGMAPPIPRLSIPRVPDLAYATEPTPLDGGIGLLTAISPTGASSALVVARDPLQAVE